MSGAQPLPQPEAIEWMLASVTVVPIRGGPELVRPVRRG